MNSLDTAAALCMHFEGFYSKPYLCPAGVATIGYGSTVYPDGTPVTLKDPPITRERAVEMLMHDLNTRRVPAVARYCPDVTGGMQAALIDFVYNLGVGRLASSTLRKVVNAGDSEAAKRELMKWVRGGGKVLPGLVARRKAEAALI